LIYLYNYFAFSKGFINVCFFSKQILKRSDDAAILRKWCSTFFNQFDAHMPDYFSVHVI